MDLNQSRVRFRDRNAWESMDIGLRLFAERKWTYCGVWLILSLPLWTLMGALFWRSPWWAGLLMWWMKPLFEAPMLALLARQYFAPLPDFGACFRISWRALWRKRLWGDLSWRRFDITRSLTLPIVVLEGLTKRDLASRRTELNRYAGGACSWLTFLGLHLEWILTYGFLILLFWLWQGNPVQDALVQPASMSQVGKSLWQGISLLITGQNSWLYHIYNLAYALVLAAWAPMYVAAGFGAYLNARTKAEAWDVRLRFERLAKRLGHAVWVAGVLVLLMLGGIPEPAHAERLPDVQTIQQQRQHVFRQPPFAHIDTQSRYCWRACGRQHAQLPQPDSSSINPMPGLRFVLWVAAILLLGVVAVLLVRWFKASRLIAKSHQEKADMVLPETVFGLDLSAENLPRDVVGQARLQFATQPREAVGLLYRASLRALHQSFHVPLADSDTEYEVLGRVRNLQSGAVVGYWQQLTQLWIAIAYAHRQPDRMQSDFDHVCQQYTQLLHQGRRR